MDPKISFHFFILEHLTLKCVLYSAGNSHRVKCALSYGAKKLKAALLNPGKDMCEGIESFFQCSLERNGMGLRPDAEVPVPAFGTGRHAESELSGDFDKNYNALLYSQWYHYICQANSPSSSSEMPKESPMTKLFQSLTGTENFSFSGQTNVLVPKVPFCQLDFSQVPAAPYGPEDWKSRGTGTYIPNMVCLLL